MNEFWTTMSILGILIGLPAYLRAVATPGHWSKQPIIPAIRYAAARLRRPQPAHQHQWIVVIRACKCGVVHSQRIA